MQTRSGSHGDIIAGTVEVVICVHDALADVQRCLASVAAHTNPRHRVILVDDGSAPACGAVLQSFASSHAHCHLIRNDEARGYARAANQGLRASRADLVVLLNSDTIVTWRWLEGLWECAASSASVGIVGPLSNAAGYQSVPKRFERNGEWALNKLPLGWGAGEVAAAVAAIAPRTFPRVAFLNGFCFAIKRVVIERIGYFDEEHFPDAYGEEDDYCLRATAAGFELAVADHAYVYHAKARSYSEERRRALKRAGMLALARKHGEERVTDGLAHLYGEPTLAAIRRGLRDYLRQTSPPVISIADDPDGRSTATPAVIPMP